MKTSEATQGNALLRQARIERNWRQHELAEQLGTTTVTVKRWERGYQQPSSYFRVKLCILFDKSAQELGLNEREPSAPMTGETVSETEQTGLASTESAALWMVPYLRNLHFTGRDDLLDQLARHLSFEKESDAATTRRAVLSQPQAVKGLGGIGKTQIAVEYAYRARERGSHTHIFWINTASEETIMTDFLTLAELLPNFPDKDEKNQHQLIAAIKGWLERCQEPWLLIFDNADDLSLVQPYLPKQGQGSILLTSRAAAVGWLADSIEVEQMGLVEGTQFLLHRTQRLRATEEECNEATNIVIALDGFPLALDQAGAYIEETGCSFGDYLQLYKQHRAALLARRGKQATNYPNSVGTTWSLSFEKIEHTNPAAAMLLCLCAYLSPDHIPEELLIDGAAYWPPLLQQAVADPFSFNELLEVLLAFSLVKRLAQEHILSLHRLVQAVQMDRMDFQEQHAWAERVVCAVNTLFPVDPKDEVDTWPQCLRYLEQAQACDTLIQQHHLQLPEAVNLLDRAGIYLREHASYNLAESLFQRALAIAEQQFGPVHLQAASPLNNLGILYKDQDKHEQAESCSRRALHIWEQALGSEHLRVALPLNNLGLLYAEQGQFEQAEPLLQRALHVWEQALGPHDSQVAGALNNLGLLYAQQGQYEQVEPLLQRALQIRERALGPRHPHLVNLLVNLGALYYEQGRYEEAEPLWQRALLVGEETLGSHHPLITNSLNNLGLLYYEQGQYEEAEPLLQRALQIREQALGPHHPRIAISLISLGLLCTEQGQYEEAEPLLQRALQIREQALGPHHLQIAEPLNGLANLSRERGQYSQAEQHYQRALMIRQEHLDAQHVDIAEILHDLAQLRERQQQLTEALSLYQQALPIREKVLGSRHPKTTETRKHLGAISQTLGRTEEAVVLETLPEPAKPEGEEGSKSSDAISMAEQ